MEYFDFDQAAFTENDQHTDLSDIRLPCDALMSSEDNANGADFLLRLGDDFISFSQPFDPTQDTIMDDMACFDDFQDWIPQTSKPAAPCDCCRPSRFESFSINEGQSACSSCVALSEPCNFVKASRPNGTGGLDSTQGTLGQLEGLHRVEEDGAPQPLSRSGKSGTRLSRAAISILKAWFDEHVTHPYPTDKEKDELKRRTGLKRTQISNWLANARRRGRTSSGRSAVENGRNFIPFQSIDVPDIRETPFEDMNPLERWKHSPPENEPASVAAIFDAVAKSKYSADRETSSLSTSRLDNHRSDSSSTVSSFSVFKAPSMASLETGRSSWGSDFSFSSMFSHRSQRSFGSFPATDKKDRRRRRRTAMSQKSDPDTTRMFQCTFCIGEFKTKHDWQRHEKTQHIPLESWTCAKYGAVIVTPTAVHCAYCGMENPKSGHLETHNFQQCMEKSVQERTFYRKDHLRQHLRLAHGCTFQGQMEFWKEEVKDLKSKCGFCNVNFTTWQARADHIAAHFKAGARMADWKGDWGFEPQILERVENATPPYAWIAGQKFLNIHPTDQMIQDQGRHIVFGNNDPWCQTAADTQAWLEMVKQKNGLCTGGSGEGSWGLAGFPKGPNPDRRTDSGCHLQF